jgi:hypothetical protein
VALQGAAVFTTVAAVRLIANSEEPGEAIRLHEMFTRRELLTSSAAGTAILFLRQNETVSAAAEWYHCTAFPAASFASIRLLFCVLYYREIE